LILYNSPKHESKDMRARFDPPLKCQRLLIFISNTAMGLKSERRFAVHHPAWHKCQVRLAEGQVRCCHVNKGARQTYPANSIEWFACKLRSLALSFFSTSKIGPGQRSILQIHSSLNHAFFWVGSWEKEAEFVNFFFFFLL
jgi:hypothetical protein